MNAFFRFLLAAFALFRLVSMDEKQDRLGMVSLTSNLLNTLPHAASQSEINALTDLYNSLNGDSWLLNTNWLTGDPCLGYWYGVECNALGNVVGLYLSRNRLNGLIPDSIANLVNLRYLFLFNDADNDASDMNVIHVFNPAIMQLKNLIELCMANVRLHGSISSAVTASLPNLQYINLANNQLQGTLGWAWTYMPALKRFEASNNAFSGNVPAALNACTNLEVFDVAFNSLTGAFPVLTGLQEIKYIDLRENLLSGTFPVDYFAAGSFVKLQYIGLTNNTALVVPTVCIRIPFCYKQTVLQKQDSGDTVTSLTTQNMGYIDGSSYYSEDATDVIP